MLVRAHSIFFLALLIWGASAAAQDSSQEAIQRLFPSADPLDPLSTGDTATLADVELATPEDPPPASEVGAVLAAIPGARETQHHVSVHLRHGLAVVAVRQLFAHSGRFPAEVLYRMNVPGGASLGALEVCVESECRQADGGTFEEAFGRDGLRVAANIRLENNQATLRVAPIHQARDVEVRWTFAAPVSVRGGVARLALPARGHDLRVAPARVTFVAEGYEGATVQEETLGTRARAVEPWRDTQLSARVREGRHDARESYRCGGGWCTRRYRESSVRQRRPVNVALALDVSPSTRGPARGRTAEVVEAFVRGLPRGSFVRAAAMAGRSVALMERREAREVPQDLSAQAVGLDLGAASRLDTSFAALAPWRRGDLMVVVGDGGLTPADALRAPRGVEVHYIQVANREVHESIRQLVRASGGAVWNVGETSGDALFEELLSITSNGTGLGETQILRGRRGTPAAGGRGVALAGDVVELAVAGDAHGSARAGSFPAATEATSATPTSLSAEPVLALLRTRLIPAARACFRTDRRGRERHSARAVYELTLEDQEVVAADVAGEIPDALRTCLRDAAGRLEVPAFEGRVQIRYPLYTVASGPSVSIELDGRASDAVDRTFGAEPTTPEAVLHSLD